MKKKIHLYFITGVAVLILISIAMADVPPPPANQDLGIYDTVFTDFNEEKCRECHSSGLPDRHHMLAFYGVYNCTDCHPPDFGNNEPVTVIRDCLDTNCHTSTPHHDTQEAIDRHCSVCHGSFVDDYDDGHYIPEYDPTNVTPATDNRTYNATTGKKWGGCEACHEPDDTADPVIEKNMNTHHNAISCSSFGNICHFDPIADIRKCEDCHGVKSIHNIQYDYDNTNGQLGYGHIGDNWDCFGCHIWFEPPKGASVYTDNIIPVITSLSKGSIEAGMSTKIDIIGNNFINTVKGNTYSSKVILVNGDDEITLEPDTISSSKIEVTFSQLDEGSYAIYLSKGDKKSKRMPFMVEPQVTINSAFIGGDEVIITGSGFNEEPDVNFDEWLGVDIEREGVIIGSEVMSWSDTMIKLDCLDANIGDNVKVNALFGSESSELIAGLEGDVNCDSDVTIADVLLLLNHLSSGQNIDNEWAADVNCDNDITIADVLLLLNHLSTGVY